MTIIKILSCIFFLIIGCSRKLVVNQQDVDLELQLYSPAEISVNDLKEIKCQGVLAKQKQSELLYSTFVTGRSTLFLVMVNKKTRNKVDW